MHRHAPEEQAAGYLQMIDELEEMLEITGFAATSLQPNSGAAEYTGLITIASCQSIGEGHRNVVSFSHLLTVQIRLAPCRGFKPVTVASD